MSSSSATPPIEGSPPSKPRADLTPPSPAQRPSAACSSSYGRPGCRLRRPTSGSSGTRWTFCGEPSGSRGEGARVDPLGRAERLVLGGDGYAFPSSRVAFERDRRRDAELGVHDYRVLRVTWRQIAEQPEAMIALLP